MDGWVVGKQLGRDNGRVGWKRLPRALAGTVLEPYSMPVLFGWPQSYVFR
jgi:hypothetical protein